MRVVAPDPPNPTGQWKRTGPKPNVEKAKQQDMRDFFNSGSSSAATKSSAASLPKAGMSADPIDAPEEPVHTPVPESAEKHGGPAAPTPYEELPHSAGLTLSFLLSILSPVLFGNADSGTRRMASRQVNRRLAPELLAGQLWHGYSTTPAFDSELPVLVAGLSSSRAASLLRHLQGPAAGKPGALSPRTTSGWRFSIGRAASTSSPHMWTLSRKHALPLRAASWLTCRVSPSTPAAPSLCSASPARPGTTLRMQAVPGRPRRSEAGCNTCTH